MNIWYSPEMLPMTMSMNMQMAYWSIYLGGLKWDGDSRRDHPVKIENEYDREDYRLLVAHLGKACGRRIGVWCSKECVWDDHELIHEVVLN